MRRNTWRLVTTCCLVVVWLVRPCEADPADADPVVVIKFENPNSLTTPWLDRARVLATEIYERAGVMLRWMMDETNDADRTLTIVLTTSTALPPGLGTEAMGVAPTPGDGTRGTTAYIFLDKISSFVASHRLAAADVIACALAHEIGHLLLPPNAHRPDSVMRDTWHPALFPPRAPGIPDFPVDQARLLRARARRQ